MHAFTATGAALGLFALLAATEARWAESFAWLGAALIVDAADGPMARRLEAKRVLPRFSGEDLDQIIDYLTYVTVPAFMVARSPCTASAGSAARSRDHDDVPLSLRRQAEQNR